MQEIASLRDNCPPLMGLEAMCDPEQVISAAELLRAALCTVLLNMVKALLVTPKFCLNCSCQNVGCAQGSFKDSQDQWELFRCFA